MIGKATSMWTTRWLAGAVVVLGLAVGGIATTSTPAVGQCWTENTDYDGSEGSEKNCLGGNCSAGWCCLICPKPST